MKIGIDEFKHYNNLRKLSIIISKPCIWSIVSILDEYNDKTVNITALISKMNSNYRAVSKCLEYMKKLNIVEEITLGRIRLIRLLNNPLTQSMSAIIKEIKENSHLLLGER